MAGYPKSHSERCISSGRITGIDNYQFSHKLDTKSGSSGSPITNDKGEVIRIHNGVKKGKRENYGIFIGKILHN